MNKLDPDQFSEAQAFLRKCRRASTEHCTVNSLLNHFKATYSNQQLSSWQLFKLRQQAKQCSMPDRIKWQVIKALSDAEKRQLRKLFGVS